MKIHKVEELSFYLQEKIRKKAKLLTAEQKKNGGSAPEQSIRIPLRKVDIIDLDNRYRRLSKVECIFVLKQHNGSDEYAFDYLEFDS